MQKLYHEIIDECIDKFRIDDLSFNFSLLDFWDDVFHNYGKKGSLASDHIQLLLQHAQDIVNSFGQSSSEVMSLVDCILRKARPFLSSDASLTECINVIFRGKKPDPSYAITSRQIARLVNFLPMKNYWDNSGVIYRRSFRREDFSNIYVCEYRYENHRRPADVLWREVKIPQDLTTERHILHFLDHLADKRFRRGLEYFQLKPEDKKLYDLYGQLFDLLNWGAGNPDNITAYIHPDKQPFDFYNFVYPIVIHGIFYGIAYFDMPPDFFSNRASAARKLERILVKGWTFVNHYFPSIILDAYHSRMISRQNENERIIMTPELHGHETNGKTTSSHDHTQQIQALLYAVGSRIPFRFCCDLKNCVVYFFEFHAQEFGRRLRFLKYPKEIDPDSDEFRRWLFSIDPEAHPQQFFHIKQSILDNEFIFVFDSSFFPGREKTPPILESQLAQTAFTLKTVRDRYNFDLNEQKRLLLDTFAHTEKTSMDLLITDLEEGLDSDLAAIELRKIMRAKKIMRNKIFRDITDNSDYDVEGQFEEVNFAEFVADLFCKAFRVWLKNKRYRKSHEKHARPDFPLTARSTRSEAEAYFERIFSQHARIDRGCLAILQQSLRNFSEHASFEIEAPKLLMQEHAVIRLQEILYNIWCNFFLHLGPSKESGKIECNVVCRAEPTDGGINFLLSVGNSTAKRQSFQREIRAVMQAGSEIKGLQIIGYLLTAQLNGEYFNMTIKHTNYIWHIDIERVCYGCRKNEMVAPDIGG